MRNRNFKGENVIELFALIAVFIMLAVFYVKILFY